jgi:HD-like signal output (HDOD) protein/CheY-like chemotaxis protein
MLKLAGHSTLIAGNGLEALRVIETKHVDLVLLDLAMPVMDGIAFLDRLRAHPQRARTPVILLTAVTDRGRIVEAASRGVRECLLKSQFSSKELLTRVQRLLEGAQKPESSPQTRAVAKAAAGSKDADAPTGEASQPSPIQADTAIPRLLTREQSLARAEESMKVATLSGVVAQVISLAVSPRSELSSLASMISCDGVLAAKVLQVANSAAYASKGGTVLNINDAVKHIGCDTVRNIAATLGIYDSMPAPSDGSEVAFVRCWQHSLAVANLCESLTAESGNPDDSSVAYLIGLCHDLGQILLYSRFPGEYAQVLEQEHRTGTRRDLLERQMLGMTHHDLNELILAHIGLPETIRGPIQSFHDPVGGGRAGTHQMTSVLRLADAFANGLMLGSQRNCNLGAFTRAECKSAIGKETPTAPAADRFRGDILAQTLLLARLPRSAERELTAPLFPRGKARILLARDPAISGFDPISSFLQVIAHARVQERLPSVSEIAEFDRVVVLTKGTDSGKFSVDEMKKLSALKPCFWAVLKDDGTVPAGYPLQPRECPVNAVDLASFVGVDAGGVSKAAA